MSCWATAESLHLLLPDLPEVLCWVVTVGFFFIASWGTKMIADSCNQNVYVERRGTSLVIGILITLFFWLFCSMPTNTHTFFYRNLINERVTTDIATTQGYLAQIKDNTVTDAKIQARCAEVKNRVDVKLGELKAEIENDANPGNGPKAKEILRDFADILGVARVEPLSYVAPSRAARRRGSTSWTAAHRRPRPSSKRAAGSSSRRASRRRRCSASLTSSTRKWPPPSSRRSCRWRRCSSRPASRRAG